MTDHSASLALASAVYTDGCAHVAAPFGVRRVFIAAGSSRAASRSAYTGEDGAVWVEFDPAYNADQFVDVQVWLLKQTGVEFQSCALASAKALILTDLTDNTRFTYFDDRKSFERAVVAAAERVAKA